MCAKNSAKEPQHVMHILLINQLCAIIADERCFIQGKSACGDWSV